MVLDVLKIGAPDPPGAASRRGQTHRDMPFPRSAALAALILLCPALEAQTTQTIRGTVYDADSRQPLPGAHVLLPGTDPLLGTSTDAEGRFRLEGVPLGRHDLAAGFLGYEAALLPQVLVTAGKEVVLDLPLTESAAALGELVVSAGDDGNRPLNEMATASARSFSVEETGRYAAGIFDPARMALNFAGVAASGDDLSNEIVVRGNSPRGLLWRLEGIEIPNPNHFSGLGAGGGAISMLSASTLARSDFYTGAFPAEFGNASSGVFDLSLRNGNDARREYSVMAGLLGIEAAAEGPFREGGRASYLVNYRYSTLALLSTFLQPVGDLLPTYQDLSFKVHVPTVRAGTFDLWGLGGASRAEEPVSADSSAWESRWDAYGSDAWQSMGVLGLGHRLLLGERTWVRTVAALSTNRYRDRSYYLDAETDYASVPYDSTRFREWTLRGSVTLHHKVNARHALRGGLIYGHTDFRYRYDNADTAGVWTRYLSGEGTAGLGQAHAQWRFRFHEDWTLQAGVHGSWWRLGDALALDPRLALSWRQSAARTWTLALGQHAKPEHPSSYYLEAAEAGAPPRVREDLPLPRAWHGVLGLDQALGGGWRVRAEAYGQYLLDVPVDADSGSAGSLINAQSIWDLVGVDSVAADGAGSNVGLDLTLERSFRHGWYLLATGSVFRSRYRAADGRWRPTAYDRGYTANVLAGKEWPVGRKGNKTLGVNGKVLLQGGNRHDAIDLAASRAAGRTVYVPGGEWAARVPAYFRLDAGVQYRWEKARTTQALLLDVQNATNRQNLWTRYYDPETGRLEGATQTGLFPFINYRVTF